MRNKNILSVLEERARYALREVAAEAVAYKFAAPLEGSRA